jgi:endonuclease/exonuclease/phosphatase family metal-dependent hydrolase
MLVALLCSLLCTPAGDSSPIKVMSFNIRYGTAMDGDNHWNKRKDFLVDVIKQYQPDLLGTQETLAFQKEYLEKSLPTMAGFGVGRDDGKLKGEMAALFYNKDRFEQLAGGHFWLSTTPDKVSKGWDAALPRIASWVRLRDKRQAAGKPLLFLNTHFDHVGKKAREESAKLIRTQLKELGKGCHVIVTGDFNAGEGSPPYQALFAEQTGAVKLHDCYRHTHRERQAEEGTFNGFKPTSTKGDRIDWICCSPDLDPVDSGIDRTLRDGRVASDHFAVTAMIACPTAKVIDDKRQPLEVQLNAGVATAAEAPRYSPPGKHLELKPLAGSKMEGTDHLTTQFPLGKAGTSVTLVLSRSVPGKPYDRLSVNDGKPLVAKASMNRDKHWSNFEAVFQVKHKDSTVDYPVALWVVAEKLDETPKIIRYSRRGYLAGKVDLGGKPFTLILSDSNNDGVLGTGDWWQLGETGKNATNMRTVGDFLWVNGAAWKLEVQDTTGKRARLVPYNPGMTEEQDTIQRDSLRADRLAKRAPQPVAFRKDVDAALAEATAKKQPCFLKFETDWCMPCKQMTSLVFTAQDVVTASDGILCIVIDGDQRKDLVEKYAVKAYPTGVLLSGDGKEITRYVGYQNVKATTAFLAKGKK